MQKPGMWNRILRALEIHFLLALLFFAGACLPALAQTNTITHDDILLDFGANAPVAWKLDNAVVTGANYLGPNMPAGWHILGTGDFDGNGMTDVLWSTLAPGGPAYLWMMTPAGPMGVSLAQYGAVPGKAWIGDFTGDGKSDILWDMGSSSPILWTMDGARITSNKVLGPNMPAGWHIVGVGDFDHNGQTDILWSTVKPGGPAFLWMMTQNGPVGVSLAQYGAVPGKAWIGDFNGDGKSDILWDMGSASPVLWTMNGSTIASNKVLGPNMPSGWHIVGTGDFNGDGLTDIAWSTVAPGGPAYLWMMTPNGPVGTNPMPEARIWGKVWTGIFHTLPPVASSNGPGTIQGMKLDQNSQPFSSVSYPGATLSIRAYVAAPAAVRLSGYHQTFSGSSANYQASLAPGDYEVGMQVPDGYQAYYSLCNNCTDHPASSYQSYGSYNSPPLIVTVVSGQAIDLNWKFVPAQSVEIPVQTPANDQALSPSDSAYDLQNLSQNLTCNLAGVPNPLAATDTQLFKGSKAWVRMGINRNIGGVGVSLALTNPKAPNYDLQVIDSRSAGGAAWQSTIGIVSPLVANGLHPIAHYNQSAGNSAEVWGFGSDVTNDPVNGITQNSFLPLFSNDIETTIGTGVVATYSPCYHSGVRFGNAKIGFRPGNTAVSTSAGSESVLTLQSTYTARALGPQTWFNGSSDEQALYFLRHATRLGKLRIYFLAADKTTLLGPIVPYDPFATLPFAKSDILVDNCSTDPAKACFIKTLPTTLAVLVWTVAGQEIAMAIHGKDQVYGSALQSQFQGVINLRLASLCSDITNDNCGSVQWHTVFSLPDTGSFQTGQGIDQTISYDFGSPAAISAMNGIQLPP